jgi:hypothetical protein
MKNHPLASAIAVALGLALAGLFIGRGFVRSRTVDRFVTVKGLAEREVLADIALWPLRCVATSDNLGQAQSQIQRSQETILAFLERHGIPAAQVELQGLEVIDMLANPYRGDGSIASRFIIRQTLMVRSNEPERIEAASQEVGQLVDAGVVLYSEGGPASGPTYLFTKLNELKPQLIAEATANARKSAAQFAQDAGSRLGGIRQANQGTILIQARDQAPGVMEESQRHKMVRVVATVDYYLDD